MEEENLFKPFGGPEDSLVCWLRHLMIPALTCTLHHLISSYSTADEEITVLLRYGIILELASLSVFLFFSKLAFC